MGRLRDIVLYRVIAGIKSEARQNYLGYIWFLLEPTISTAILYIAFSQITGHQGAGYIAFLVLGMMSWQWFESSVMNGATSIRAKFHILNHFDLPKPLFPLVAIGVNTWKFLCVYVIILAFCWLCGFPPTIYFAWLPLLFLLQLLLIVGITLIVSMLVTLANDCLTVISSIFRLLFFLSGIFFAPEKVPASLQTAFFSNPIASLIVSYRDVILHARPPHLGHLAEIAAIALITLGIGLGMHAWFGKKILKLSNA